MRLKSVEAEKAPDFVASATDSARNMFDVALPLVQRVHLVRINVESQHGARRCGQIEMRVEARRILIQ